MRVRMKADVSGTRNGESWPTRGQIVDLPDDEAASYLYAGVVEVIDDIPPVETADTKTTPKRKTSQEG